jgi:hypothetical protein
MKTSVTVSVAGAAARMAGSLLGGVDSGAHVLLG